MDLPKQYIKIARDITGYWGTWPPDYRLSPGMIGKPKDSVFIREDYLKNLPGYDRVTHAVENNALPDSSSVYTTKGVSMKVLSAGVATAVVPVSGKVQIHFGANNETAIICKGNRYRSFSSLTKVKELILGLDDKEQWNRELCVVTDVLVVKAAWILFATEKDQTAEVEGSAPIDLSKFAPVDALKELAGKANLVGSFSSGHSAGIFFPLPKGGTPLFHAIRLKKDFARPVQFDYVMGLDSAFEEPTLGEA